MPRKSFFLILVCVLFAVRAFADVPADPSILRWACAPDSNAPYSFFAPDNPNQLTGFEYDVITAIATHMGRRPVFIRNDWDGLIPGLGRGLYDCVICGVEINPEHAAEVTFSQPYYTTFEQMVVRKGSPAVYSLSELAGKQIGTLNQTAAFRMLSDVKGIQVKPYTEEVNAYNDVANGRIYGVLLDFPIALYYASPNPELQFTGPPFGQISYGIAMKKGNTELQGEINQALAAVIASGEMRDILSKWNLWTPTMAKSLGQSATPSVPPSEFNNFIATATGSPSFLGRLDRYWNARGLLLRACWVTLSISLLSMVLAVGLGFFLAILRVYGFWPLKLLATLYIEIVRGTPLLIQLLFIFYGLPNIGIKLAPIFAGILGLGLNYAAYEAENYRAGLLSIPKGQMEAARALGMTHIQGLRHVVIPQAFKLVLPPVTNDFISLLKDSSLVSMITIVDLTGAYTQLATTYFDYFGTGIMVAILYLLIGLPFVRLARYTESRLSVDTRKPGQRPGGMLSAIGLGPKKA